MQFHSLSFAGTCEVASGFILQSDYIFFRGEAVLEDLRRFCRSCAQIMGQNTSATQLGCGKAEICTTAALTLSWMTSYVSALGSSIPWQNVLAATGLLFIPACSLLVQSPPNQDYVPSICNTYSLERAQLSTSRECQGYGVSIVAKVVRISQEKK